ncbi:MAG: hypothetical protein HOV78_21920 [Hamadaea sp.]|nr:hypothetical protein [Hamadaea sp.]NUT03107.1 hypothetical protein [Hamadaea sp.]
MTEPESFHTRQNEGQRKPGDASVKVAWIGAAGVVAAAAVTAIAGVVAGLIHLGPDKDVPEGARAGSGNATALDRPSPSAPDGASPSSPAGQVAGATSLLDVALVGPEYQRGFSPGTRKVNAVEYEDVYAADLVCYVVGTAAGDEFQLDRKYRRLVTKVGLGDAGTASGIRVKFTVAVDGAAARSVTVTLGQVKTLEVDVSGALRMSLTAEILNAADCEGHAAAAWITPMLT